MATIIVGAGLAGLSAALRLTQAGERVRILERSDQAGGRLKTDVVEGFRLDHGFQVAFTAYPAMRELLDYAALEFRAFEPGSLHWDGHRMHLIHREKPLAMALSSYLPLSDKLKILSWTRFVQSMPLPEIWQMREQTAEALLRERGFSDVFLERFARPFFGGIFLDRSLQVSARMFAYVWRMLSSGDTVVPSRGIAAIPAQLAAKLPPDALEFGAEVRELLIEGDKVKGVALADGRTVEGDCVILATEATTAARLTGLELPAGSKSSTCVYFGSDVAPTHEKLLVLNATGRGRVNEVVPISNVAPELAPKGQHLISATILGWIDEPDAPLAESIRQEVAPWFPGKRVSAWRHLRTYRIEYAQMPQPAGIFDRLPGFRTETKGLYLAGEFNVSSSIQGALEGGMKCAATVLEDRR